MDVERGTPTVDGLSRRTPGPAAHLRHLRGVRSGDDGRRGTQSVAELYRDEGENMREHELTSGAKASESKPMRVRV